MAAALGYSLLDLFRENKTGERAPSYVPDDQDTVPHFTISEINEGKETKNTVKCPFKHGLGTYAVTVEGTAMSASYSISQTYPEGSIIFVDPSLASKVKHMDIVAATLPDSGNAFTFRRLQIEAGQQYLVPINPQFPPMIDRPFKNNWQGDWRAAATIAVDQTARMRHINKTIRANKETLMRQIIIVLLSLAPFVAQAGSVNVCTDADGNKTFQSMPCAQGTKADVKVIETTAPSTHTVYDPSAKAAAYEQMRSDNAKRQLDRDIRRTENKIVDYRNKMQRERRCCARKRALNNNRCRMGKQH